MKKTGFCEMLRTSQKPGKMEGRNPVGNHGSYGCIENSLIHSNENSHYSRNHRVLLSVFPPAGAGRPVKPVVRKFVFDVIAQRKEFVNKKIQKSKVSGNPKDGGFRRQKGKIYFCFQVFRENSTRMGKISNLPASIAQLKTILLRSL